MSLAFAQGSQKLVIKMTGGVTFYTSFEVQPVTTIMLKERGWKKTLQACCIMLNFEGHPSLPPSSVHRWTKKKRIHTDVLRFITLRLQLTGCNAMSAWKRFLCNAGVILSAAKVHIMHILAETIIEQSEHTVQMVRSRKWADLTLYGALKHSTFFHSDSKNWTLS